MEKNVPQEIYFIDYIQAYLYTRPDLDFGLWAGAVMK